MGGGGMGRLEPNEKYVVILEILGPRDKDQAKAFNEAMDTLMKDFKITQRRYSYRAVKDVNDQKGKKKRVG